MLAHICAPPFHCTESEKAVCEKLMLLPALCRILNMTLTYLEAAKSTCASSSVTSVLHREALYVYPELYHEVSKCSFM